MTDIYLSTFSFRLTYMHHITQASPLPDYHISLSFGDGVSGEVDLSHLVGKGIFSIRQKPGVFEKVEINPETGTIQRNDTIDLCPDSLYQKVLSSK